MFAYNPTVNDMSGQIMGQGMIGAASTRADTMSQVGQDIGGAIASLAGNYAEGKALEAKGLAYGDFLKRHGTQLGLDPEYLDNVLKMKPQQLAFIGDNVIGMNNAGRSLMALNYQQQTANLFGGNRGTNPGGGGGGGNQVYVPFGQ